MTSCISCQLVWHWIDWVHHGLKRIHLVVKKMWAADLSLVKVKVSIQFEPISFFFIFIFIFCLFDSIQNKHPSRHHLLDIRLLTLISFLTWQDQRAVCNSIEVKSAPKVFISQHGTAESIRQRVLDAGPYNQRENWGKEKSNELVNWPVIWGHKVYLKTGIEFCIYIRHQLTNVRWIYHSIWLGFSFLSWMEENKECRCYHLTVWHQLFLFGCGWKGQLAAHHSSLISQSSATEHILLLSATNWWQSGRIQSRTYEF